MMNTGKINSKDFDCLFDDKQLSSVITLQEACYFWAKSPRQVYYAIDKDKLSARKSVTGGSWLINRKSAINLWGEPHTDIDLWMV